MFDRVSHVDWQMNSFDVTNWFAALVITGVWV